MGSYLRADCIVRGKRRTWIIRADPKLLASAVPLQEHVCEFLFAERRAGSDSANLTALCRIAFRGQRDDLLSRRV